MSVQAAHLEASLDVPHTYGAVTGVDDEDMEGRVLEHLAELETLDSINVFPQTEYLPRRQFRSAVERSE
jgi:hypothetical protein